MRCGEDDEGCYRVYKADLNIGIICGYILQVKYKGYQKY